MLGAKGPKIEFIKIASDVFFLVCIVFLVDTVERFQDSTRCDEVKMNSEAQGALFRPQKRTFLTCGKRAIIDRTYMQLSRKVSSTPLSIRALRTFLGEDERGGPGRRVPSAEAHLPHVRQARHAVRVPRQLLDHLDGKEFTLKRVLARHVHCI